MKLKLKSVNNSEIRFLPLDSCPLKSEIQDKEQIQGKDQEQAQILEKNQIVDEMLKSGLRGEPDPAAVEKLKKDLSPLPLEVLQNIKKFGIKIFITKGGGEKSLESLLDSGIFKEVSPRAFSRLTFATQDVKFRKRLQEINKKYQPEIEKSLENVLKLKSEPAVTSLGYLNAQENLQQIYQKMNQDLDNLSTEFLKEKVLIRRTDFLTFALGDKASGETIARYHGAVNRNEIKEYLSSVSDINPEISRKERAGNRSEEYLFFPDFCYATQPWTGKRLTISGSDYHAVKEWDDKDSQSVIEGMYIPSYKTVFLREDQLGASFGGNNVTLHEIGHAYEDSVKNLDPDYYRQFEKEEQEAKQRADWNEQMITLYAGENEHEFLAESFAACFSPRNRLILEQMDESWLDSIQKFIFHSKEMC
jgi:hypothetical protein